MLSVQTEVVNAGLFKSDLVPTHLRSEYRADPLGIDVAKPRLAVHDNKRGMMKKAMISVVLGFSLFSGAVLNAQGEGTQNGDPAGVLKKPIPDKLIVLTFDDGPLSGYTVCAPILKSFGFSGSFYVCDFDSFKSRRRICSGVPMGLPRSRSVRCRWS